jgi:thiol-disulfide isomerase/thioredoxin
LVQLRIPQRISDYTLGILWGVRRLLVPLLALAVVAAVVVGLTQTRSGHGGGEPKPYTVAQMRRRLAGAPRPLAALHRQGSEVLGGGKGAVQERLAQLRGRPVVLNKWASWCVPCRTEFPLFNVAGVDFGKRVAFLGLDSGDNRADAQRFLRKFPVSYPSYEDPNERIAFALGVSSFYPMTAFYDAAGRRQYVHAGKYPRLADLERDIRRYALGNRRA